MSTRSRAAAVWGGALACLPGMAFGSVWDCVADFSALNNPSGAWSYGWTQSRNTPFQIFTTRNSIASVAMWGPGTPAISKNLGSTGVLMGDDPVLPPGVMMAHPGPGGENAVLRWTSPITGSVRIAAHFGGVLIDPDPDTVDVAVLYNGGLLFLEDIVGVGGAADYGGVIQVGVGDTVDFHVGFGPNGSYYDDSTALSMTITTCPVDMGAAGGVAGHDGVLDNNDFIAFINLFFAHSALADVGRAGGVVGSDGQFDNNDFISFISMFFAGCG